MKKKLVVALLAILMLGAFAACSLTQVTAMAFSVAPASTYTLNDEVYAKDFTVQVDLDNGTSRELALNDAVLTVQGLVDGKLDTSTVGQKTLRISYRGFSFTFTYTVYDPTAEATTWEEGLEPQTLEDKITVESAKDLAQFMVSCNSLTTNYTGTVTLAANIDLSGKQWVPINHFGGTFDGAGYTISNLTILNTNNTEKMEVQGLFGLIQSQTAVVIENVTLDNVHIEETNAQAKESKNYGAVIGTIFSGGNIDITVRKVTVTNAFIKGTGRLGGIVGFFNESAATLRISECYVQGSITSINPVTVASDDGEGDKVGGIIGQAQALSGTKQVAYIQNCNVLVQLAGTRDVGGIVGYLRQGEISGCKVLAGSELRASVPGGMLITKGSRNVGGIVGTVSGIFTLGENNEVQTGVTLETNGIYEYSNTGILFSGFRGQGKVSYNGTYYYLAEEEGLPVFKTSTSDPTNGLYDTASNKGEVIASFLTEQDKMVDALEEAYGL